MYREWPSRVPGAATWTLRVTDPCGETCVLPDGCMDLILSGAELLVAGADTRAQVFTDVPGTVATGIRFAPGYGPAVFGVPANELRDQRVPLSSLWPRRAVLELADRLTAGPRQALEAVALERLAEAAPEPLCTAVVTRLERGDSVARVARDVGFSERQLHRRCLRAFGYGPKTLAKVLRFNRALELARAGSPLAAVAAKTGYADQSHLCLDVRSLTGMPIKEMLPG